MYLFFSFFFPSAEEPRAVPTAQAEHGDRSVDRHGRAADQAVSRGEASEAAALGPGVERVERCFGSKGSWRVWWEFVLFPKDCAQHGVLTRRQGGGNVAGGAAEGRLADWQSDPHVGCGWGEHRLCTVRDARSSPSNQVGRGLRESSPFWSFPFWYPLFRWLL